MESQVRPLGVLGQLGASVWEEGPHQLPGNDGEPCCLLSPSPWPWQEDGGAAPQEGAQSATGLLPHTSHRRLHSPPISSSCPLPQLFRREFPLSVKIPAAATPPPMPPNPPPPPLLWRHPFLPWKPLRKAFPTQLVSRPARTSHQLCRRCRHSPRATAGGQQPPPHLSPECPRAGSTSLASS